jgi:hypothetical protein
MGRDHWRTGRKTGRIEEYIKADRINKQATDRINKAGTDGIWYTAERLKMSTRMVQDHRRIRRQPSRKERKCTNDCVRLHGM